MRILSSLTAAVAVGLTNTAFAARALAPRLLGVVGPGYTITLKENGKAVRALRHGTYTFVISDRSNIHDFTIDGPGLPPTVITGDGFTGTNVMKLRLSPGTYEYYCLVHEPVMHGSFRVT